ncbi:hypothetical protein ABZ807_05545 [Micromonospora sp. NPDC047548]|uniref:hypothetical protein n=1 Tax=Micromonospora sp. NPDC047548 TaxID=3155624 RepID=UPI0033C049C7
MALLATQDAAAGLANVARVAANGGGDTVAAGSRAAGWDLGVFLLVQNADATATTVTVDGVPYSVPATTGLAVIPVYRTTAGTIVAVTYSKVTTLTVAAVQLAGK